MKQPSCDPVDSQSSDSDSEQEQGVIAFPTRRQERACRTKTYLLVVVFFAVVMLEVYWFLQTRKHENTPKIYNISHQEDPNPKEAIFQQASYNMTAIGKSQNEMKSLVLPQLSSSKTFGNSNFLLKDLRKGGMQWFDNKEIECESDKIVNSASKIQQHLFLQKTAYSNVNILYRKVTIPAEILYQLEGPHQLMRNLSKKEGIVIAYAHSDPLLLVLAASYSNKGLFVSNSSDWPLMKTNLILNDFSALATPVSIEQITTKKGYDLLITDNFSLVDQLLLYQRRELVILMEIKEPIRQQSAVLLRLKVYRFEEGQQCDGRRLSLYQQSAWHVQESAILLPSWYVFTLQFFSLPLQLEKKQYQTALFKIQSLKCINLKKYESASIPFNDKYILQKAAYEGMHLLRRRESPQEVTHYSEILAYLQNYPPNNLYLHSGSSYMAFLAISTLKKDSKVTISPNYDLPLLTKNLVLNNLQVQLLKKLEKQTNLVIITADLQEVMSLNASRIILTTSGPVYALQGYSIRRFKAGEQCNEVELLLVNESTLEAGNYLLVNDSAG